MNKLCVPRMQSNLVRQWITALLFMPVCICNAVNLTGHENQIKDTIMEDKIVVTQEWDKVFAPSSRVNHSKITFHNRYGITLVADLYMPKDTEGKFPAIAEAARSEPLRSRHRACMPRNWQGGVSLQ